MTTSGNGARARVATVDDAAEVARLLHDFNLEFGTPTPGTDAIAAKLRTLLATDSTFALLAGDPPVAVALVTLRSNVWYEGLVSLLDELYVEPELRDRGIGSAVIDLLMAECRARGVDLIEINVDETDVDTMRFYERHGFAMTGPDDPDRAFYWFQELRPQTGSSRST